MKGPESVFPEIRYLKGHYARTQTRYVSIRF